MIKLPVHTLTCEGPDDRGVTRTVLYEVSGDRVLRARFLEFDEWYDADFGGRIIEAAEADYGKRRGNSRG